MFIKIGDNLINLENVTHIMKKKTSVQFDFAVSNHSVDDGVDGVVIHEREDIYPQALAAYEFLCKGAMTFDTDANAPETMQPDYGTATPQADSEATGEYRGMSKDDYSYIYRDDELLFIGVLTENSVTNLLRTETATLREQNARLQAELDKARERVSELQTRINDARYIVGGMPNHPDGQAALYAFILDLTKPYSGE